MIIPFNNQILVELLSNYKHAVTTDAKTVETKSKGLCVDIAEDLKSVYDKRDYTGMDSFPTTKRDYSMLKGKVVYFDEFEDTTNYTIDGKKYALIDIKHIKGYDDAS